MAFLGFPFRLAATSPGTSRRNVLADVAAVKRKFDDALVFNHSADRGVLGPQCPLPMPPGSTP